MSDPQLRMIIDKLIDEEKKGQQADFSPYVSPALEIFYNGELRESGVDKLHERHNKRWESSNAGLQILEVKELPSENAMRTKVVDRGNDKLITTTIYFGKEGGQWRIVRLDTHFTPNDL